MRTIDTLKTLLTGLRTLWQGPAASASPPRHLSREDLLQALRNAAVVGALTGGLAFLGAFNAHDWGGAEALIASVVVFLEGILSSWLKDHAPAAPPPPAPGSRSA